MSAPVVEAEGLVKHYLLPRERLFGPRPAVRAVDASTGVQFLALVPEETGAFPAVTNPGELVSAKVVRVTRDSVLLEREENGRTLTEIVPPGRVYAPVQGGFVPANSVRRLRAGAEVFIPVSGAGRGTISITRSNRFGTRSSSSSTAGNGR